MDAVLSGTQLPDYADVGTPGQRRLESEIGSTFAHLLNAFQNQAPSTR
jgi:hypothetical protein